MSNTTEDLEVHQKGTSGNLGRNTPLGTPTQRMLTGMRRRTELGLLFVLQYQAKLSPGQWAYLLGLQRKVSSEELESAIRLFGRLLASQRSLARAHKDLEKILARTPHLNSKSIRREQRRIGVGYRDKGVLRRSHENHDVTPRSWWSEDIAQILHLSSDWMISKRLLTEEDLAKGGTTVQASIKTVQARNCGSGQWDSLKPPTVFFTEIRRSP
jgi:hypothetical protein